MNSVTYLRSLTVTALVAFGATRACGDYYVDYENGSDDNAGQTSEAPLKTIFKAVEKVTADGSGTILLADGVHKLEQADPHQVTLSVPTTIKSISGDPSMAKVLQTKSTGWDQPPARCFKVTSSGCEISGLTLDCGATGGLNNKEPNGGIVWFTTGGNVLSNCILTNGITRAYGSHGGGVFSEGTSESGNRISRCVFTQCKSAAGGCYGDAVAGSYTTIDNCLFSGCMQGNSVIDVGSSSQVLNCTVVNNKGIGLKIDKTSSAINCLLVTALDSDKAAWAGTAVGFNTCYTGSGTAINDTCKVYAPTLLFADYANGDYTLASSSPALNCGATYAGVSDKDLAGGQRVVMVIDLGCYENQSTEMQVSFSVTSLDYGKPPFEASFAATAMGGSGTGYAYSWDFEDTGTFTEPSASATATHVYDTPGTYSVTLRVTDSAESTKDYKITDCIKCTAMKSIYVWSGSRSPKAPYDTWDCAAANIPEAVRFADDGATVIVTNGTYAVAEGGKAENLIKIEKAVRLVSFDGIPSNTVIQCPTGGTGWNNQDQRAVYLNHGAAFVSGFTLANGSAYGRCGSQIAIDANGGTVSNCVLRKGYARNVNIGGAAWINCPSGLVTHCVFDDVRIDNVDKSARAGFCLGGTYVTSKGGRVENCLFKNIHGGGNGGGSVLRLEGGSAVNCTIVDATSYYMQGAINVTSDDAQVVNCVEYAVSNLHASVEYEYSTDDPPVPIATNYIAAATGWTGKTAPFLRCAFETATLPNDTCLKTDAAAFADYANGDYVPAVGGALYNKGMTLENPPDVDLSGKPRVVGRAIDIGCYERFETPGMLLFVR